PVELVRRRERTDDDARRTGVDDRLDVTHHERDLGRRVAEPARPWSDEHVDRQPDVDHGLDHGDARGQPTDPEGGAQLDPVRARLPRGVRPGGVLDRDLELHHAPTIPHPGLRSRIGGPGGQEDAGGSTRSVQATASPLSIASSDDCGAPAYLRRSSSSTRRWTGSPAGASVARTDSRGSSRAAARSRSARWPSPIANATGRPARTWRYHHEPG